MLSKIWLVKTFASVCHVGIANKILMPVLSRDRIARGLKSIERMNQIVSIKTNITDWSTTYFTINSFLFLKSNLLKK